ncbi:hypothetical protein Tco_1004093 [Tanacetum coccineum]|uniref:Reverse transcriptase Ty1/copia-type domain-containing protein n=1 Tax=Tanacetum coccineum TaxID=301880 RepID=A0ABQ5FB86_9ASTR
MKVEELLNVTFDKSPPPTKLSLLVDDDIGEEEAIEMPLPKNQSVIGTKWVYRNRLDENGIVSRNKARLVAQRSTCHNLCDDFAKIMHDEYDGRIELFLGLPIKQMEDGIFFNQSRYIKEMLKKFRLEDSKPTNVNED